MLFKLLGLPITMPLAGFRFCVDQLIEVAEQEVAEQDLMDDAPVREALLLLNLRLEEEEISAEEFRAEEARLVRRLREIRAYREAAALEAAGLHAAEATPDAPTVLSVRDGGLIVEIDIASGDRVGSRDSGHLLDPPGKPR